MTDVERLREVRTVISHRSCPDGTAAAMICARALHGLGLEPDVRFVQYDTREQADLPAEPGQLFVDITPPLSRWREWLEHRPIVLDHHDTAEEAVRGLGGVYGYPEESGASLAFLHVFKPVWDELVQLGRTHEIGAGIDDWAEFARLAKIRDTWQDGHEDFPRANGVAHALNFFGSKDLVAAARRDEVDFARIRDIGAELYSKLMRKAELYADTAHLFDAEKGGRAYRIGVFNCSEKATSEAAHILLDRGCDVAVGYFMLVEDGGARLSVSLRSRKGGVPVNAMAERMGGGGHPPAAGFRIADGMDTSLQDLCDVLLDVLPE